MAALDISKLQIGLYSTRRTVMIAGAWGKSQGVGLYNGAFLAIHEAGDRLGGCGVSAGLELRIDNNHPIERGRVLSSAHCRGRCIAGSFLNNHET